ncbi:MAG: DUF2256 domain-containing protein [Sulfuritalea sp.]|nr:DUF2256 domain-containing protein [Polynucleobacter sp.]MCF8188900.1 DUF2256 domain-containing protein [Sulfuritalea sp.]
MSTHTVKPFRNPHNLPVKQCEACQRPYTWRKKWALNWEQVRYCSDACRKSGAPSQTSTSKTS